VKIEYNVNYSIEIRNCKIDHLTDVFKQLFVMVFSDFVKAVLKQFGDDFMKMKKKPFHCLCGNDRNFIWKTKDAKPMKITTIFADLILPQMQVQCKDCGKKMFISRLLLGIERYQKMSTLTERILAFVGGLATFRTSEKILGMVGVSFNRMKVWRCVQKIGKTISFDLDPKHLPYGEADGTGIPIVGIKKRGQELKVFIQKKVGGGVRIAGLAIGKYDSDWAELFAPLRDTIMSFKNFLLVTDGDTSILNGVKCLNVIFQRCLWHIPHQLKYCMWKDGIKKKSADWMEITGKIFDISAIRPYLEKDDIDAVIREKRARLDGLISFCEKKGYKASTSYLINARPDMFSALEKRLNGKSSSLAERLMKTVNMRVNVGKWSPDGALNAMKLRLAHYYNGWTPYESEITPVNIQRI